MDTKKTRKPKAPTVMQPETASTTTTFTVAGVRCRVPAEFYNWVETQLGGALVALDIIVGHQTWQFFDVDEWNNLTDDERSMAKICFFHVLHKHSQDLSHPFLDPLITDLFADNDF